jgi:hypothetical protein
MLVHSFRTFFDVKKEKVPRIIDYKSVRCAENSGNK